MAKGTKVKASGVVLFVPLAPPRLDDISHDALVEWRKRRTEYEDQVATRCASTKEDASALLVPVKSTMDRRVLETLCKYEWGTTVEEISEGELNEKLLEMVRGIKNDTLPDVDALFERLLHMDLHESDVKARVIKYFGKCDDIISQHGLVSVFETAQGSKEKCTQLRARLSPKALHDAVENAIRFTDPDAKTKPTTFYKQSSWS